MATRSNNSDGFFRNNNPYAVSGLTYPADLLGSAEYGRNYVMFNINVHEDSKLAQNPQTPIIENVTSRVGRQIAGQNFTNGEVALAAGATAAGVGALAGGIIDAPAAGGAVAVGATLVAVGSTANLQSGDASSLAAVGEAANRSFTRQYKRIADAIALHIPNALSSRYSVQYEEADTMGFQAMASIARGIGDAGGAVIQSISNGSMEGLGSKLTDALTSSQAQNSITAGVLQNTGGMGKSISALSGQAANPKKEQVFSQVDFRTFTFDYQFYPRSEVEAANVAEIIKKFKYHMHPEFKSGTDFLYIYPAEFDITYYSGGAENGFLHRHAACVLTEMNLNYAPQGQFTTFSNGIPTQVNMTLTFRELVPMTKETLESLGEV